MSAYTAEPPHTTVATPGVPGGNAQHFVTGADIPAEWWTLFHSTELNALIAQALAHNADLGAAQAALRVAHENTRAQKGAPVILGRDALRPFRLSFDPLSRLVMLDPNAASSRP